MNYIHDLLSEIIDHSTLLSPNKDKWLHTLYHLAYYTVQHVIDEYQKQNHVDQSPSSPPMSSPTKRPPHHHSNPSSHSSGSTTMKSHRHLPSFASERDPSFQNGKKFSLLLISRNQFFI